MFYKVKVESEVKSFLSLYMTSGLKHYSVSLYKLTIRSSAKRLKKFDIRKKLFLQQENKKNLTLPT